MEKGIALIKRSADTNLGYGQFIYGRIHHYGGGSIEKDLVKAEYWMQQAIKNGYPQAENLRIYEMLLQALGNDIKVTKQGREYEISNTERDIKEELKKLEKESLPIIHNNNRLSEED